MFSKKGPWRAITKRAEAGTVINSSMLRSYSLHGPLSKSDLDLRVAPKSLDVLAGSTRSRRRPNRPPPCASSRRCRPREEHFVLTLKHDRGRPKGHKTVPNGCRVVAATGLTAAGGLKPAETKIFIAVALRRKRRAGGSS
jgi:hypothetical protein